MAGFGGSQPVELFGLNSDAIIAAIQAALRGTFTSMPAIVSEDGDGHTASAAPTINQLVRQDDGTMKQTPWPSLKTMPIHFAGGGLMVSTHPVKAKDEGILVFAARALDSWHQSGGPQNPIDARQHSASDGFYLGGVKSDPNKIANYTPDTIQHRSLDGKTTHEVAPTSTTTKVVPASDMSTNPFASATTFFQTLHNAVSGIVKTATDGTNFHTLTHSLAGILGSVTNGTENHTFSCPVADGPTLIGQSADDIAKVLVKPGLLQLMSTGTISLSAPSLGIGQGAIGSSAIGGVNDGTNAAAGTLGEYLTANGSVSMATGTLATICTLTLSPGDWDVSGLASFAGSAATITNMSAALAPGDSPATGGLAQLNGGSFQTATLPLSPLRVNVAVSTNIMLQMAATFASGTVTGSGSVRARRMR